MLPVTQDHLERLAFDHPGTEIHMYGRRAWLTLDGITYGSVTADPLAAIDAHPRCRVAASGSHLDAEQVSDQ